MKKNYFILFTILAIVLFQTCKPKQNLTGKNEKQTNSKLLVSNDTIPANYVKNENNQDTIKQEITQRKSIKDTAILESIPGIPVMNPKIHPITILDTNEEPDQVYDKLKTKPELTTIELSDFNPFLEKMYPGTKWRQEQHESHELYINRYIAVYKGAEFVCTYLNSFVYYFYDIGEISHDNLIKTAIYWCLQPEYPNIIINEIKLYEQRDEDQFNHFDYYHILGHVGNDKLEVYIIIRNHQIATFKAYKNKSLIKLLGSFI